MTPRSALPFACLVALALAVGCSNQGEGEVCDVNAGNAGNDDCQSGLVCTPGIVPGERSGRCCPAPPLVATTTVCAVNHLAGNDASPAVPPDAGEGGADVGPIDAPMEGATDAPAESATDATVDSPGAAQPEASPETGAAATDGPLG